MFGDKKPTSPDVEIEAIFLRTDDLKGLHVQIDETSKPFWIPRKGVVMRLTGDICKAGRYAVLKLSERKAVNYGLI